MSGGWRCETTGRAGRSRPPSPTGKCTADLGLGLGQGTIETAHGALGENEIGFLFH